MDCIIWYDYVWDMKKRLYERTWDWEGAASLGFFKGSKSINDRGNIRGKQVADPSLLDIQVA